MKKILALLLLCCMLTCLLCACGNQTASDDNGGNVGKDGNKTVASEKNKDPYVLSRSYAFDSRGMWRYTNEYVYDENNNLVLSLRNGFRETAYIYDDNGNIIRTVSYDETGRITDVADRTYSKDGTLVSIIHSNGDSAYYNEDGKLVSKETGGQQHSYSYDKSGNLLNYKRTTGNDTVEFAYTNDSKGRNTEIELIINNESRGTFLTRENRNDNSYTEYYYGVVAPLWYKTNITIMNNVGVGSTLSDTPVVQVDYNTKGNVSLVTYLSDGSTAEYSYAAFGDDSEELLTEIKVTGNQELRILKEYNEQGKLLKYHQFTVQPDGTEQEAIFETNEYDADGRVMIRNSTFDFDCIHSDRDYYEWVDEKDNFLCMLDEAKLHHTDNGSRTADEIKSIVLDNFHEKYPDTAKYGVDDVYWSVVSYGYFDFVGGSDAYHVAFVIPGVTDASCCSGNAVYIDDGTGFVYFDDDPTYQMFASDFSSCFYSLYLPPIE